MCLILRIVAMCTLCAFVGLPAAQAQGDSPLGVVRIGFVKDGPMLRAVTWDEQIKMEILELTAGEFDVRFPEEIFIEADQTIAGVRGALERLQNDPDTDLIITIGPIASHMACLLPGHPKPLLATVVLDHELQGIPWQNGTSGIKNLNYLSSFSDSFKRDMDSFLRIVSFQRLTVVGDIRLLEAMPLIDEKLRKTAAELGIDLDVIGAETTAISILDALPPTCEAVYVSPLMRFPAEEFQKLVNAFRERKLPTFSLFGGEEVEAGLLAGISAEADLSRLARRVAVNVQRVLLGEDPGTFTVSFTQKERLTINMATARAIGVWPSFAVLSDAILLHEEEVGVDRLVSLRSAVVEAMAANVDLLAAERSVAAGAESVKEARGALLPRLDVGANRTHIDKDRARAGLGRSPERVLRGNLTLTQLIWSEDVWAGFDVEGFLQESRRFELEALRLDIALDAAVAYLNVLRVKTNEKIQKDNLELTRSNLDLARSREAIGVAGAAEVYRWESEIASSRKAVVDAQADRRLIELELNRLLHRPLDEEFLTEQTTLDDPLPFYSDNDFSLFVNDPWSLKIFRDFTVSEGLTLSPELRQVQAAIAAQKRLLTAAERSLWLPTFAVQGSMDHTFSRSGEGSSPQPDANDTDWSVGLVVEFPLFSGGSKYASRSRNMEELRRLAYVRQSVIEKVETNIRAALHRAGASHPGIQLSRDAADAARKNLELVTDSYSRGVVSIIDLLDAQNAFLVAGQVASNAVFDFLIDVVSVKRAAGCLSFFESAEEREAWFQRLTAYFEKARRR
jgi:outer membrane protein